MSKRRAAAISNAQRHKASETAGLAIPPHGPDALFNQPGVGGARARRRRRIRTKALNWGARGGQSIGGRLRRGDDGRFAGEGGSEPSSRHRHSQATREVRQRRLEELRAAREQEQAEEEAKRAEEDAYIAAGKTGHERQQRRREVAQARRGRARARRELHRRQLDEEREKRRQEDEEDAKAGGGKKGGGGKGGKKKPSADEKRAAQEKERAANRAATAPKAGLSTAEAEALAAVSEGRAPGAADTRKLRALGLMDDTGATDAGRRLLRALERGNVREALAAIQDGRARLAREQQRRQREDERRRRGGTARRRQRENTVTRQKAQATFGGKKRSDLPDSVFAGPDRSFPIVTAQDVRDAVRSLGRTRHDKAAVRRGIIRRARAIGAVDALPESWKTEKAQSDQEKAMFANMGGGGSGGGGGGKGSSLWSRGPSGSRQPTRAQAEQHYERREAEIKRRVDETRRRRDEVYEAYKKAIREGRVAPRAELARARAAHDKAVKDQFKHLHGGLHGYDIQQAKSLTVFKDARGRDRWAAITTTAYQDKDDEWITCKAIAGVVAAGDATGQRGPLRFWHVPGLDLGDCDYQATAEGGRVLIESGTFRNPVAARIGQQAAARGYQMSPGFLHTRQEPRGGAFDHIALFERSFLPPGRASNPYTRLLTKGDRMLTDEKRKEFEALAGDADGRALLESLLSQAAATTKAADEAGAVYKDAPEWAQALIARIDGLEERVKAFPPAVATDEEAAAADDDLAALEEETAEAGEPAGMDDEAFADLIVQKLLAGLVPHLDLEKKMAGYVNDIKTATAAMVQPMATKDDARAKEIADLQARLKELEGEQPRARTSLAASAWGDLTGIPITKEQAAALTAKPAGEGEAPVGLNGPEVDAYKLIYGEN